MVELTLEAVKEQFCIEDKQEALKLLKEQLENALDIEWAAELTVEIGKQMEKETQKEGVAFTPGERLMWAVKEGFIAGCLDTALKMMTVNDMGYDALAGK